MGRVVEVEVAVEVSPGSSRRKRTGKRSMGRMVKVGTVEVVPVEAGVVEALCTWTALRVGGVARAVVKGGGAVKEGVVVKEGVAVKGGGVVKGGVKGAKGGQKAT
jgi:hypothetical protein